MALEIEVKAQGQERAMAAWGVQCAIADLLSDKGKAMKTYMREIGVESSGGKGGAANPHTEAGQALGKRISALLARDEL